MTKKIYFIGIIFLFVGIFGVTSCQQNSNDNTESKQQLYYVEGAVLAKSDVETVTNPYKNQTSFTYAEVKQIRAELRSYPYENFFSEKDVTRNDCSDFLTSHGCSPKEADSYIDALNEAGNAIMFFTVNYSSNYLMYIYAEKQ